MMATFDMFLIVVALDTVVNSIRRFIMSLSFVSFFISLTLTRSNILTIIILFIGLKNVILHN